MMSEPNTTEATASSDICRFCGNGLTFNRCPIHGNMACPAISGQPNTIEATFSVVERPMMFWPYRHGPGVERMITGRLYGGDIFEPIGQGVKWHMGIPEACDHPFDRIKWANSWYPSPNGSHDYGTCIDCGESRSRYRL